MTAAYARGTPMRLCLLYLEQAACEAERAVQDPQRWFFAVPEMHRALNCALVAALSGSAKIGAYPLKIRRQWVAHFEHPDWPDRPAPRDDRVDPFTVLLARAQDAAEPEMHGRPIVLTEAQRADLARLTDFRDDMEHVKPRGWSIQAAGLPRILAAAAEVIDILLREPRCCSDLTRRHEASGRRSIRRIRTLARGKTPASRRSTGPRSRTPSQPVRKRSMPEYKSELHRMNSEIKAMSKAERRKMVAEALATFGEPAARALADRFKIPFEPAGEPPAADQARDSKRRR